MIEKNYGGRTRAYGVIEREDGLIELRVYHWNMDVRRTLDLHRDDPSYFLERGKQYMKDQITARRYLAEVMEDYYPHFRSGRVRIVFC